MIHLFSELVDSCLSPSFYCDLTITSTKDLLVPGFCLQKNFSEITPYHPLPPATKVSKRIGGGVGGLCLTSVPHSFVNLGPRMK